MKAKIDDLCRAFAIFNQEMIKALTHNPAMSRAQHHAAEEAAKNLRDRLTELGLYDHIDWTV